MKWDFSRKERAKTLFSQWVDEGAKSSRTLHIHYLLFFSIFELLSYWGNIKSSHTYYRAFIQLWGLSCTKSETYPSCHINNKSTKAFLYISVPQILMFASISRSKWFPERLEGIKIKQNWFSLLPTLMPLLCLLPAPFHSPPLLFPGGHCGAKIHFVSVQQQPCLLLLHTPCDPGESPEHISSGISIRCHRDPKLPAFSGLVAPAKASHGRGRNAAWGELTKCGVRHPVCQQTAALVFHCRPFIGLGLLCSFPGTKSTSWEQRSWGSGTHRKPFLFACTPCHSAHRSQGLICHLSTAMG